MVRHYGVDLRSIANKSCVELGTILHIVIDSSKLSELKNMYVYLQNSRIVSQVQHVGTCSRNWEQLVIIL